MVHYLEGFSRVLSAFEVLASAFLQPIATYPFAYACGHLSCADSTLGAAVVMGSMRSLKLY